MLDGLIRQDEAAAIAQSTRLIAYLRLFATGQMNEGKTRGPMIE